MNLPTRIPADARGYADTLEAYLGLVFPRINDFYTYNVTSYANHIDLCGVCPQWSAFRGSWEAGIEPDRRMKMDFAGSYLCRSLASHQDNEAFQTFLNDYCIDRVATNKMQTLLKKRHIYVDRRNNIVTTVPTAKYDLITQEFVAYTKLLLSLRLCPANTTIQDALIAMLQHFGEDDTMVSSITAISSEIHLNTMIDNVQEIIDRRKFAGLLHGRDNIGELEQDISRMYNNYLEALSWLTTYKDAIKKAEGGESKLLRDLIHRALSYDMVPKLCGNEYMTLSAILPLTNCDPKELNTYKTVLEQGLRNIRNGTPCSSAQETWTETSHQGLLYILTNPSEYQLMTYTNIRINVLTWNIQADENTRASWDNRSVIAQPHIMGFNCFATSRSNASDAFKDGNMAVGLAYLKNSMQQLTLSDTIVVNNLITKLRSTDCRTIKRMSDNKMLTWKEFMDETINK